MRKETDMGGIINLAAALYLYAGSSRGAADATALNVYRCDRETGSISLVQSVKDVQATTYFQLSADGKVLYAAADGASAGGKARIVKSAVEDGRLGRWETLADLPCEAPCHVALSPDGGYVAFAAYSSGTVGIVPTAGGGKAVARTLPDIGVGPNKKRQKKAYAHFAFFLDGGRKAGFIDLGCDKIHFFETATMHPIEQMSVRADPGDGPRHAVFSGDGKHLFVLNELSSSVTSFAFTGSSFKKTGKWSMLPEGFDRYEPDRETLSTKAAAIKLSADGKLLMASNRGYDSIAFFDVAETGLLKLRNISRLKGRFPRDFELMPGEKFMVVGHKLSNEIQVYRFDRLNCTLTPHGPAVKAWMPLCFKFGDGG